MVRVAGYSSSNADVFELGAVRWGDIEHAHAPGTSVMRVTTEWQHGDVAEPIPGAASVTVVVDPDTLTLTNASPTGELVTHPDSSAACS